MEERGLVRMNCQLEQLGPDQCRERIRLDAPTILNDALWIAT